MAKKSAPREMVSFRMSAPAAAAWRTVPVERRALFIKKIEIAALAIAAKKKPAPFRAKDIKRAKGKFSGPGRAAKP